MAKFDNKEWRAAIRALKVLCPLSARVSVTRVELPDGDLGDCDNRHGRYYIRVQKMEDLALSLLILTHEWAHAMIWPLYKDRDPDHTGHFGIAWAEAYRTVFHNNK